jgi:hypothetical protein
MNAQREMRKQRVRKKKGGGVRCVRVAERHELTRNDAATGAALPSLSYVHGPIFPLTGGCIVRCFTYALYMRIHVTPLTANMERVPRTVVILHTGKSKEKTRSPFIASVRFVCSRGEVWVDQRKCKLGVWGWL